MSILKRWVAFVFAVVLCMPLVIVHVHVHIHVHVGLCRFFYHDELFHLHVHVFLLVGIHVDEQCGPVLKLLQLFTGSLRIYLRELFKFIFFQLFWQKVHVLKLELWCRSSGRFEHLLFLQ